MAEYTLHCFAQSGNAYKAALMLNLSGCDWTPRFVDYFNGETRTPAFRAINAMGTLFGVIIVPGLYYIFGSLAEGRKLIKGEDERPLSEEAREVSEPSQPLH